MLIPPLGRKSTRSRPGVAAPVRTSQGGESPLIVPREPGSLLEGRGAGPASRPLRTGSAGTQVVLSPCRATCPGAIMIELNRDARMAAIREKVEAGQRL